jgi:hypothetical protein
MLCYLQQARPFSAVIEESIRKRFGREKQLSSSLIAMLKHVLFLTRIENAEM